MMPLLLSVGFGGGIYLVYDGFTRPRPAARHTKKWRRVEEFLSQAGLHEVRPRDFVVFSLGTAIVGGSIAQLLLGWIVVSFLVVALGLVGPLLYYRRRRDCRRGLLQDALMDATGQLRDSIRTGLSVQNALLGLAHSGPETLRPEFVRLGREIRLLGFEPAMTAMRERLADPVYDVVAASLLLNDRLGGRNVSQVLDRLAQATRAELRVQQEIQAYQAKNILSAQIVAAVPLVVLIAIRAVNPSYLSLFDGPLGQILLAGCASSVAVGYAGMLWITRLPGERRVLQS
jgi:tight adherence protein B